MTRLKKFHFKSIDSTSAYLLRRRFALRNFTFCSSDYQTEGRGRTGRKWESNDGENLLFSVLIKGELAKKFSLLSVASATAVINALETIGVKDCSYKFPNDVYACGKKICGILLESVSDEGEINSLVVGFGINLNQTVFPDMEGRTPTSVALEKGKEISVKKVKKVVYKSIIKEFLKVNDGDLSFIKTAIEKDFLKGKAVFCEINGEIKKAVVNGLTNDGKLSVEYDGKSTLIYYGEITFHDF